MDIKLVLTISITVLSAFSVLALFYIYIKRPKEERLLGEHKVKRKVSAFFFLVLGAINIFQWYCEIANQFALYIGALFLLFGIIQLVISINEKNT